MIIHSLYLPIFFSRIFTHISVHTHGTVYGWYGYNNCKKFQTLGLHTLLPFCFFLLMCEEPPSNYFNNTAHPKDVSSDIFYIYTSVCMLDCHPITVLKGNHVNKVINYFITSYKVEMYK